MNGQPWSNKDLFRLVDLYAVHSAEETAALLGRSVESIRAATRAFGLVKVAQQRRRRWTDAETKRLREAYPEQRAKEIAEVLSRDLFEIYRRARVLGLKKSEAFYERERIELAAKARTNQRMIASRFRKGQAPANKGVKRPGWSSGRMCETQFKKGQKSWRAFPVGHIGPDPEGFLRIKIREPRYVGEPYYLYRPLYAHLVWEQHKGPIPPKHLIVYFETLEMLKDPDKPMDLARAKTISDVAQTIINSAKVEVEMARTLRGYPGTDFVDAEEDFIKTRPAPISPRELQPRRITNGAAH